MNKTRPLRPIWPDIPTGHLLWILPRARWRLWLGLVGGLAVVVANAYWLASPGELMLPRWFVITLCILAALFVVVHSALMLMIIRPGAAELRRRQRVSV